MATPAFSNAFVNDWFARRRWLIAAINSFARRNIGFPHSSRAEAEIRANAEKQKCRTAIVEGLEVVRSAAGARRSLPRVGRRGGGRRPVRPGGGAGAPPPHGQLPQNGEQRRAQRHRTGTGTGAGAGAGHGGGRGPRDLVVVVQIVHADVDRQRRLRVRVRLGDGAGGGAAPPVAAGGARPLVVVAQLQDLELDVVDGHGARIAASPDARPSLDGAPDGRAPPLAHSRTPGGLPGGARSADGRGEGCGGGVRATGRRAELRERGDAAPSRLPSVKQGAAGGGKPPAAPHGKRNALFRPRRPSRTNRGTARGRRSDTFPSSDAKPESNVFRIFRDLRHSDVRSDEFDAKLVCTSFSRRIDVRKKNSNSKMRWAVTSCRVESTEPKALTV